MLEIKGIFLLSDVQYEGWKRVIPPIPKRWWLKTSDSETVSHVKTINSYGEEVLFPHANETVYVRPALVLNDVMPVGCVFEFAGLEWTIVSSIYKIAVAICNGTIAQRRFDSKSNEWDKSEIKKWLEEWIEYICIGSDEAVYDPEFHY